MKDTLLPGLVYTFEFRVPESKIVPALFPESDEFQAMPHVLATGYMVGLINVNHIAPTPPGLTVRVTVNLKKVDGRKLLFAVEAEDEVELISKGTHERFVIYPEKFNRKVKKKLLIK